MTDQTEQISLLIRVSKKTAKEMLTHHSIMSIDKHVTPSLREFSIAVRDEAKKQIELSDSDSLNFTDEISGD